MYENVPHLLVHLFRPLFDTAGVQLSRVVPSSSSSTFRGFFFFTNV